MCNYYYFFIFFFSFFFIFLCDTNCCQKSRFPSTLSSIHAYATHGSPQYKNPSAQWRIIIYSHFQPQPIIMSEDCPVDRKGHRLTNRQQSRLPTSVLEDDVLAQQKQRHEQGAILAAVCISTLSIPFSTLTLALHSAIFLRTRMGRGTMRPGS